MQTWHQTCRDGLLKFSLTSIFSIIIRAQTTVNSWEGNRWYSREYKRRKPNAQTPQLLWCFTTAAVSIPFFPHVILGSICNSYMDPFFKHHLGSLRRGIDLGMCFTPWRCWHWQSLCLLCWEPCQGPSWVWSQLTHRGLVLHPAYSLVSANLLSVFHGQFLKGPVWLNKSLDNSKATTGSGLRESCSQSLPCANREPKLNSNGDMSWENDPRTQETDTYAGYGPEIKSVTSNTADLIQLFKAVWNYGGGLCTILPFLSQHTKLCEKVPNHSGQEKHSCRTRKTEVMGLENSQGSIYQLMLWSEKWWFFHLSCPYVLSVQVGLLRLGNELGIWAGDKRLFSYGNHSSKRRVSTSEHERKKGWESHARSANA